MIPLRANAPRGDGVRVLVVSGPCGRVGMSGEGMSLAIHEVLVRAPFNA
jgi:hypothetical protein